MKDSTEELNTLLFEQLRAIKSATGDDLDIEIKRGKAITSIAEQIVNNARVGLEGRKYLADTGLMNANLPHYLQIETDVKEEHCSHQEKSPNPFNYHVGKKYESQNYF